MAVAGNLRRGAQGQHGGLLFWGPWVYRPAPQTDHSYWPENLFSSIETKLRGLSTPKTKPARRPRLKRNLRAQLA
jgi:hypothetical protein